MVGAFQVGTMMTAILGCQAQTAGAGKALGREASKRASEGEQKLARQWTEARVGEEHLQRLRG